MSAHQYGQTNGRPSLAKDYHSSGRLDHRLYPMFDPARRWQSKRFYRAPVPLFEDHPDQRIRRQLQFATPATKSAGALHQY